MADKPANRQPTANIHAAADVTEHGKENLWYQSTGRPEREVRRAVTGHIPPIGMDSRQESGIQDHEVNDDRTRKPLTERITGFISTIQRATRALKERAEHLTSHVRAHFEGKRDIVQASRGIAESNDGIKQANDSIREPVQSEQRVRDKIEQDNAIAERRYARNRERSEQVKEPDTPSHKPNYPTMGL